MSGFASSLVRNALMAAAIATAMLAGVSAHAATGPTLTAPAVVTAGSAGTAGIQLAQWGPRQCCRRVGLQYVCGPC